MIKTKLFHIRGYFHDIGNTSYGVGDYLYCIYIFGFMVRSVPVNCVNSHDIARIFPGKEIKRTENPAG